MKNDEKITQIVSKEALEQVDELIAKLKVAVSLQNKLSGGVAEKVKILSDLVNAVGRNTIPVSFEQDAEVRKLANEKLKQLIPLL